MARSAALRSQFLCLVVANIIEGLVHLRYDMKTVVDDGWPRNREGQLHRIPIGLMHVHGNGLDGSFLRICQAIQQNYETGAAISWRGPENASAVKVHQ